MFDPSKLKLDIDENNEENNSDSINKDTKEKQNIKDNQATEQTKETVVKKEEVDTNKDVLADLSVEKKHEEEPQEKKEDVLQNLEEKENISKKDEPIKKQEKNIEEDKKQEDITKQEKVEQAKKAEEKESDKIIYDINITSVKDILYILIDKWYDFVTLEPDETFIKINFRKNKSIVETKYIKYPVYSNILIKAKSLTKLQIETVDKEQEWSWEAVLRNKNYEVLSKIVPGAFGEKMFLKTKEKQKKVAQKKQNKMSTSQILTFVWAIAFIWLVLGGSFIWFVAMNAQTVQDVQFFSSLWINLNEINNFISSAITIIFSILVFFETALLSMVLFKFLLTKKEFKKKKIKYWILSAVLLVMTFSTASAWMIIDRKVNELPNWQEMALWEIQIFDNSKLISEQFDKVWALVQETNNLIWPVELKFDLSFFQDTQESQWNTIQKYTWDFGWDDIVETPLPTLIKTFDQKWINEVSLTVTQQDLQWNIIEKVIEDIPSINISYLVEINQRELWNWAKQVNLDANDLEELWSIEWYLMENLDTPIAESQTYITNPIFEETLIWMYIRNNSKESEVLDKIFVIKWPEKWEIEWKIDFTRWIVDDMEYSFRVDDIENWSWRWFIESFFWTIWDKEYTKQWQVNNETKSSEIKHIFKTYWDKTITVEMTNTYWDTKTLTKTINVPKKLNITKEIDIYADDELVKEVDYRSNTNEYMIDNLWIPNEIKLDSRFIEIDSNLYTLQSVDWDYDSDWDNDFTWRVWELAINSEWNHTISFVAKFQHRRIPEDIVEVEQKIYIEAVQKEAIVDFVINKNSEYTPVVVGFDASRSSVKDSNIAKFIWDYGDWEIEERDAVVPWHIYTKAWEYDIKLTVVTRDWKRYSTTKSLILKPRAQTINIQASMKSAPTYQWIDFSSNGSDGQISSYFWDFWDWNTSTQANPTHSYERTWEYEVKLRIDFTNRNVLEENIKINIY